MLYMRKKNDDVANKHEGIKITGSLLYTFLRKYIS